MTRTVIAFDLYGTLLSTESISQPLAENFGQDQAKSIAALWRRYQLEYTWRLNSMNKYDTFSNVTRNSLLHALAEHKVSLSQADIEQLMKGYDSLSTFPDAPRALTKLSSLPDLVPVIFSNGTQSMISNSVHRSADLSPSEKIFHDVISVEPVKKFKPAPEVYYYLAEKVGKDRSQMGEMWLISGNPFDIMGAMNVGMNAAWVDRAGLGWMDSMNPEKGPTVVMSDLEEAIGAIEIRSK